MEAMKTRMGKILPIFSEFVTYAVAAVLLIAISIVNPMFISINNLGNILSDMSALLCLSIGVTFILLIGSIDLSIGAISSCACVIYALSVEEIGLLGILLTLAFGMVAGFLTGGLYVKLKIPSFIVTFGTMSIWQSLALVISKGAPQQIGRDYWGFAKWFKIKFFDFLPLPFVVAIVVFLIFLIVEKKTAFGRSVFATGGNENAARTVGIKTDKTKMMVFMLMGLMASVAGIFFASNLKSGIPTVGEPFTLYAIAAVALGGTSLSGGKGGLIRSLSGVLLVILIQNGMNVIGVDAFLQKITFGAIILIALLITADRKRRNLIVK